MAVIVLDGQDNLHQDDDFSNIIYGQAGNDTIYGNGGGDLIFDGVGDDLIFGGDGADQIYSEGGIDRFYGGAGSDAYIIQLRSGSQDTISDTSGDQDEIYLGGTAADWEIIREGFDLVFRTLSSNQEARVSNHFRYSGNEIETLHFGSPGNIATSFDLVVRGTESADTLTSSFAYDAIIAGGGNDVVTGDDGDDVLYGGDGDDTLFGGAGNDTLYGDAGNDTLYGEDGDDTLYSGSGIANYLYGGAGNDLLIGGPGTFGGGGNASHFYGGEGDDTYQFDLDTDAFYLHENAGEGVDTIRFGAGIGFDDLTIYTSGNYLVIQRGSLQHSISIENQLVGTRVERLLFDDGSEYVVDGATVTHIDQIGTDGDDTLTGTANADTLFGYGGNDTMSGLAGNDVLYGGEGNDTLSGDEGNDTLHGEAGDDTLYSGSGTANYLYGGAGNDLLIGGPGTFGGGGNASHFYGGEGDDTYQFNLDTDAFYLHEADGEGADTIRFGAGIGFDDLTIYTSGNYLVIQRGSLQHSISIENQLISTRVERLLFDDGSEYALDRGTVTESGGGGGGGGSGGGATGTVTYRFSDGDLTLQGNSADDRIIFENDAAGSFDFRDMSFQRSGDDLLVSPANGAVLTLSGHFAGTTQKYEFFQQAGVSGLFPLYQYDQVVTAADQDLDTTGSVLAGTGDNVIRTSGGRVYSGDGNDTIINSGSVGQFVYAGSGDDLIYAGTGTGDEAYGRGGNDIFYSNGTATSASFWDGGTGDDVYHIALTSPGARIEDRDGGTDRIHFQAGFEFENLAFRSQSNRSALVIYSNTEGINPDLFVEMSYQSVATHIERISIADTGELYTLGQGTITADDQDNTVRTAAGSYDFHAGAGDDHVVGYNHDGLKLTNYTFAQNVDLFGEDGDDTLFASGIGRAYGGNGNDVLHSSYNGSFLFGEDGDDTFYAFDNIGYVADGGAGSDIFFSNTFVATASQWLGGEGDDHYHVDINSSGFVIEDLSADLDTLYFGEGLNFSNFFMYQFSGDMTILSKDEGALNVFKVTLKDQYTGDVINKAVFHDGTTYRIENNIDWYADDGDNEIHAAAGLYNLHGGKGNDILHGTVFNSSDYGSGATNWKEVLYGDEGDDIIYHGWTGTGGPTWGGVSYGGTGNDIIHGTDYDEAMYGGEGDDILYAYGHDNASRDIMDGGAGNDIFHIGTGTQKDVTGGTGWDVIYSDLNGPVSITGSGKTHLKGGEDNDVYVFLRDDIEGMASAKAWINDSAGAFDTVALGEGFTLDNVIIQGVTFLTVTDLHPVLGYHMIEVNGNFPGNVIERVVFADGTIYDTTTGSVITATEGDDNPIYLTAWHDTFDALGGNDTVYALEGDDRVDGNTGDDVLYGEAGDDTLIGGAGNDTLHGGVGFDTADYSGATSGVVVNLKSTSWTYDSNLGLTIAGLTAFDGQGGIDSLVSIERIVGSSYDDRMLGSGSYDETFHLGDGNDFADGSGGDDILYGEGGDDVLRGGTGNDRLYGGSGNDTLVGYGDDDFLSGGAGDDVLSGSGGVDTLSGGDGDDTITDLVDSIVDGGAGFDWLRLYHEDEGVEVDLENGTMRGLASGATGTLTQIERVTGSQMGDTLIGSAGDDQLYGLDGADTIFGGAGDDNLYGQLGNDVVRGGDGNDKVNGNEGDDLIYGDAGDDQIAGGDGIDTLWGGSGNDVVYGGLGDTLYGEEGDDGLLGYGGEVVFDGGAGMDGVNWRYALVGVTANLLTGQVTDVLGRQSILTDIENLSGSLLDDILIGDDTANWIYGNAGFDRIYGHGGNDNLRLNTGGGEVYGGAGNDVIYGSAAVDYIEGGEGDDTINVYRGADTVFGGAGRDLIHLSAAATVDGGDGAADTVYFHRVDPDFGVTVDLVSGTMSNSNGDAGAIVNVERVSGTNQADDITADANNNMLWTYSGDDIIRAGDGRDYVDAGAGNDIIYGGDGDDASLWENGVKIVEASLLGGDGNDIIYGEGGTDRMLGGEGDDLLYGGADRDWLYGNNGADSLSGGLGADILYGNAGADTFIFASADLDGQIDRIMDFNVGDGDQIDVSDLLIGFSGAAVDIADFVRFDAPAPDGDISLAIDLDGAGTDYAFEYIAQLDMPGTTLDAEDLFNSGQLIAI